MILHPTKDYDLKIEYRDEWADFHMIYGVIAYRISNGCLIINRKYGDGLCAENIFPFDNVEYFEIRESGAYDRGNR